MNAIKRRFITNKGEFVDTSYVFKGYGVSRISIYITICLLLMFIGGLLFNVTIILGQHFILRLVIMFVGMILVIRMLLKFGKPIYENYKEEIFILNTLNNFIFDNNLYTKESEVNNGVKTTKIIHSLKLGYNLDGQYLIIRAYNQADIYSEKIEKLEHLEAALGLSIAKKQVTSRYVDYYFSLRKVERYNIDKLPLESQDMTLRIFDNQNISLKANYSTLISGASGAGKSYVSYYVISSFISKYVVRNGKKYHAKIWAIDPKMSDIYKLMELSKMPKNQYGTTVEDAFRIVGEFTEELEKRKEIYLNMAEFDKVLLDLNYEPQVLYIDEYPSLVALMDNKQKKEWEKLLGNIARLSRQLSLGLILVMQQANASSDGLPTSIKEQLVNKIFMGNSETISQQSSEMVFGRSRNDLPSPVFKVGEGLISIDGKEPVSFLSPKFNKSMDQIVLPVLKNVAKNYKIEEPNEEINVIDEIIEN